MYGCHLKNLKQNVLNNFVKNKVDQEATLTTHDDLLNHKIGIKKPSPISLNSIRLIEQLTD